MIDQLPGHLKKLGLSWNDCKCITLTDNDSVFRYITSEYAGQTKALFDSGLIDELVDKGLLQPGKLQKTGISEYPLLIRHPFLRHLSYPFEWPSSALKEVALSVLEIETTANGYGYSLYDPHPYNAIIKNGHPLYLDYGSLTPIEGAPIWHGYEKAFRDSMLYPLELYEKKLYYVSRLILREIVSNDLDASTRRLGGSRFQRSLLDKIVIAVTGRGEITSDRWHYRLAIAAIDRILANKSLKRFLEGVTDKARPALKGDAAALREKDPHSLKTLGSRADFLKRLRGKVASLQVSEGSSHWSEYYKNTIGVKPPWERDTASWTVKERHVHEIMSRLKPETVLDIGANTGWFSLMFAHNGASVISFDRDEESINQLYSYARGRSIDILPLIMDVRQPTPEYELNIGTISSAAQRYQSELALALGIIHHMVCNQGVSLPHLVHLLSMFTRKYLLIEFVPVDDAWAKLPALSEESWNVPALKDAFGRCFRFEGSWESYPRGRELLLFIKKG